MEDIKEDRADIRQIVGAVTDEQILEAYRRGEEVRTQVFTDGFVPIKLFSLRLAGDLRVHYEVYRL